MVNIRQDILGSTPSSSDFITLQSTKMYTMEQLMERRVWWDKFTKIKDDIVQGDACYCKEKW